MKKLLTIVALAMTIFTNSNAQFFAGGSFGISSSTNSHEPGTPNIYEHTSSSISISPMLGYFINDKFAVGASLDISTGKNKTNFSNGTTTEYNDHTTGFTPFARYYFANIKNISLFAEAQLGLSTTKRESIGYNGDNTPETNTVFFNIKPALSYKLNEHFDIEAYINILSLGTSHSVTKNDDGSSETTNSTNFGAGLNVGVINISAIYRF